MLAQSATHRSVSASFWWHLDQSNTFPVSTYCKFRYRAHAEKYPTHCHVHNLQLKVWINLSAAALTQTRECVLLAVMSIYPHHSLAALSGWARLHKHRGWGHGCSFTSAPTTSKSPLLTGQMNAPRPPAWYIGPSCCLLTVVRLRLRPHHGARAGPFVSFSCISETWL